MKSETITLAYVNPRPLSLDEAIERQERIKRDLKQYLLWKRREEERND